MTRPGVRPFALIAAALVIGGLALAVWPQHGLSIAQIVTVTAAVAAALHAVRVNTGSGTSDVWGSPLTRLTTQPKVPTLPFDLDRTRSYLSSTRIRYRAVALPWGTARQLSRTAAAVLERRGIDLADPSGHRAARALVSPLTWAVLTYDRDKVRGERRATMRADARNVARIVHTVLDELDRLAGEGGRGPQGSSPQATRGTR